PTLFGPGARRGSLPTTTLKELTFGVPAGGMKRVVTWTSPLAFRPPDIQKNVLRRRYELVPGEPARTHGLAIGRRLPVAQPVLIVLREEPVPQATLGDVFQARCFACGIEVVRASYLSLAPFCVTMSRSRSTSMLICSTSAGMNPPAA